jgi:hypothetical protein
MNKSLFNRMIQQLLPEMNDADARKSLIELVLYGSPILNRILWTGDARLFTVHLIRQLEDFGDIEAGRPAIVAVIDKLISEFGTPTPPPEIALPDKKGFEIVPSSFQVITSHIVSQEPQFVSRFAQADDGSLSNRLSAFCLP